MRARYAISNIAAIGRPGRCGPVSYRDTEICRLDLAAISNPRAPEFEGLGAAAFRLRSMP
ncbi:MAG: hypothetical protein IPK13_25095 [Deltaproteobacteria bacterium]|nr:hypothetical protein [Deltaproteobacteria bacterium]